MIRTIIYLKKLISLNYEVQRCEHSQNNTKDLDRDSDNLFKGNGFILICIYYCN